MAKQSGKSDQPAADQPVGYDCIVIGGGIAGLAAALVLGRARRATFLVDRGKQSNRAAKHVGGLLGYDGTAPGELYELARAQVRAYDSVTFRLGEVVEARAEGVGFRIELADGEAHRTRSIVLAPGMDYEVPNVPGFAEHWGEGVFHCPFCHGWEVRDRTVAVYGSGEIADRQAALLAGWTDQVTIVDPEEVVGVDAGAGGEFRGLERRDGSVIECDAVLVHTPLRRHDTLAEQLGLALRDDGSVEVDRQGQTSVPGVYAAGDVAISPQQVAVALGSGHLAGLAATRELLLGRD